MERDDSQNAIQGIRLCLHEQELCARQLASPPTTCSRGWGCALEGQGPFEGADLMQVKLGQRILHPILCFSLNKRVSSDFLYSTFTLLYAVEGLGSLPWSSTSKLWPATTITLFEIRSITERGEQFASDLAHIEFSLVSFFLSFFSFLALSLSLLTIAEMVWP